jgi:alkylated DNA repair protein (DNA oxidative demethylase)
MFLFGGAKRNDPVKHLALTHGDVVVWGGPARMNYHGIAPIKSGLHPMFGDTRINLTLRAAL